MADPSTCLPLTPASIRAAHAKIAPHIHRTPLITSKTLNEIASSPNPEAYFSDDPPRPSDSSNGTNGTTTAPRLSLHFKLESQQRIGAFKARGAFHALTHLIEVYTLPVLRQRGVVTHSSGNHAQALALAASEFGVPSYIVMPGISTKSKVAGTKRYASEVIFSGSTSVEREDKVAEVMQSKSKPGGEGPILVPPYDHPDIILGQGTTGLEISEQFTEWVDAQPQTNSSPPKPKDLDCVITPLGGGGLTGGVATFFSDKPKTRCFGAEPSFQGGDDARRGLAQKKRIENVKTLTIADGLRTPVGVTNWDIISDKSKLEGVYAVTEEQIKMAMRLVWERMKCVVEPSGCVGLAVVLFNGEWRNWVVEEQRKEAERGEGREWEVCVVFSGGNTTMEAVAALFGPEGRAEGTDRGKVKEEAEREIGKVGVHGERVAENVAG